MYIFLSANIDECLSVTTHTHRATDDRGPAARRGLKGILLVTR